MRFGFELKRALTLLDHMSGPGETGHPDLGDSGQNFEVTVVTPPFLELWVMVSPCAPALPFWH